MKTLTVNQSRIYKAIFKLSHRRVLSDVALQQLQEDITHMFGHDITEHFLIPVALYDGKKNSCYYLQNILLYSAYMNFVAQNSNWPPAAFLEDLSVLCLKVIKEFFSEEQYKPSFDENFCEHIKKTCVVNFQALLKDTYRIAEILTRQFRLLAYTANMKVSDPEAEYRAISRVSKQQLFSRFFTNTWNMLTQRSEKKFAEVVLERARSMLKQYDCTLSPKDTMRIESIQSQQSNAISEIVRGSSSYDTILGFWVLTTTLCFIMSIKTMLEADHKFPYYLMATFLFACITTFYKSKEPAFLKQLQEYHKRMTAALEASLHEAVKIESMPYRAEPSRTPASQDKQTVEVQIYQFCELPDTIQTTKPRTFKRKPVQQDPPTVPSPAVKKHSAPMLIEDLADVPAGMQLRCVDVETNLYLLYDPKQYYGSDWIVSTLEKAHISNATGLKAVSGDLYISGRKKTVKVYELKNLHSGTGQAKQRLLIPVLQLQSQKSAKVSVLDCRAALFLKNGLHQKGISEYRFDPNNRKICAKNAVSGTLRITPEKNSSSLRM